MKSNGLLGELAALARGVLRLEATTIAAHVASPEALKRGLLLLVIVSLLAGFFPLASRLAGSFGRVDMDQIERDVLNQIQQQLQMNPAWQDPELRAIFEENFKLGFAIARQVVSLRPNVSFLPGWLENVLRALGEWLSTPLAWLGAWAGYALWVMLFAKLLGGRATLERLLAATTLFVVPQVLNVLTELLNLLGRIPVAGACFGGLGLLVSLAATVWSAVVYVKATAAANEFSLAKAALATLLPALVLVFLVSAIGLALIALVVVGSAS